jgi:hypothetical protein
MVQNPKPTESTCTLKAGLYWISSFLKTADERTDNMAQLSRNEGVDLCKFEFFRSEDSIVTMSHH